MKKIISIIIIILFLMLFIFVNDNRNLTIIEKIGKDVLVIPVNVANIPIKYFKDKMNEIKIKNDIYRKYDKLKEKLKKYELLDQKYNEAKKELDSIKSNLNIKDSLIDYEIIDAYVINRNIGYFYDTLIINKGEKDKLKIGLSVVNSKGMIGTIIKTTYTTSTVKLLTSISTPISVKINDDNDYIYGILKEYKNGYFIIDGISDTRDIKKNSKVTTTGLDNKISSGIEVGNVEKTVTDSFEISRKVYVKPCVNFGDIDYVMVLNK